MPFAEPLLDIWTAAERGLQTEVMRFVASGIPVDARSRQEFTPLHMAARAGHVEIVKWLLDNGAKINGKTKAQPGYPGAETALFLAVVAQQEAVVEYLLKRGANPNVKSSDTTSALAEATQHGNRTLMTVLIEHGALLNPKGGVSPLLTAVSMKNVDAATVLIEHGARIDEKVPPYSGSLLSAAAGAKWLPGVELFLSLGLAVNEVDQVRQAALHYGVLGYGSRQLTWVKTEHGEKCIRDEPEEAIPVVRRLLEAGADPTLVDGHGFTALDYAKKLRALPLVQLLTERAKGG
jgi:ankyrin repeat protein